MFSRLRNWLCRAKVTSEDGYKTMVFAVCPFCGCILSEDERNHDIIFVAQTPVGSNNEQELFDLFKRRDFEMMRRINEWDPLSDTWIVNVFSCNRKRKNMAVVTCSVYEIAIDDYVEIVDFLDDESMEKIRGIGAKKPNADPS